jgi:glycerol uptake facilitator-like aquaporin
MIGAIILGFGVAAAWIGRKESFEAAFTIGGALLLGLVIGLASSASILNPAVALGVGALDVSKHWLGIVAYGLGPIIGATAGAWLYKLLQSDIAQKDVKNI